MATAIREDSGLVIRDDRRAVRLWARLSLPTGEAGDVVVRDISATGFRFETREELPVGSDVTVRIGGLPPLSATVRRDGDGEFGCVLDAPLDAATLDAIRVNGPFASAPPPGATASAASVAAAPDAGDGVRLLPFWARAGIIAGASGLCWAGIFSLAYVVLG